MMDESHMQTAEPFLAGKTTAPVEDRHKRDESEDATREAFFISVISVLVTSMSSLVGLGLFINAGSTAMLGFALVNTVDTVGSLCGAPRPFRSFVRGDPFLCRLMLWRFEGGGDEVPASVLERREDRSQIGLAVMFVLLGLTILATSIQHYVADDRPNELRILIGTGATTFLTSLTIGVYKLVVAKRTDSDALYMDGVCSLNGALLSFSAAGAAVLYRVEPTLWWSDLLISSACALWLVFYGAAVLSRFKARQWWTPAFWHAGKKDDDAAAADSADGAARPSAIAPDRDEIYADNLRSPDTKTRAQHCRERHA